MIKIEWKSACAEISADLWQDCFSAPFEGVWWYEALEKSGLEDQFTFMYGVVYEAEKPVAIAPAFVMNVPIRLVVPPALLPIVNVLGKVMPSLLYQRTLFIGSPCSDEGRVGMIDNQNVSQRLLALNQAMQSKADELQAPMRVWKDFSNQHQAAFETMCAPEGLFKLISFPGTEVKLAGNNLQGYLGSLKSSRRSKLNKKLKQPAPVDVQVLQQPDAQTLDEIFALFWQTYEKGDTKFERLNRRFFELISAHSHSFYVILREQNTQKILAFMLCFKLSEHVINKFIGIDYGQPKEWFLYFKLWQASVEWAYSVGANVIQSGQTGYAPKIELGNDMVALTNYCRHKNPLVHWIYAKVAATVNWNTLDEDLAIFVKAYPALQPKN